MQDSTRRKATVVALTVLLALSVMTPGTLAQTEMATETPAAASTFEDVTYFDGNAWQPVELMAGTFDGPAGGASPTARLKADLGGPKTYFTIGGGESAVKISVARPRFRLAASEGVARTIQLAQFESKDGARRTTIEISKNVTVFKRGTEVDVTKISEGVYEVRPKKSLQPGEYALVISETGPVADFTIVDRGY